ncbi:MAG: hemolysin III family protein [Cyclobacteriaceae bacterium]|nr:hemolysin III family protein [Cyclobacteriaceae bacterium]
MYPGERLNSITHLIGAAFSLVGLGALMTVSILDKDPLMIVSFSIYGFSLVVLYTMSTLYHSFRPSGLKTLFRKLDHISIYLLIAGTYGPFMLVSLRNSLGPVILAAVWAMALIGICLELFLSKRRIYLQLSLYIGMGWACSIDYQGLLVSLPGAGLFWLAMGGVGYMVGVVFYVLDLKKKLQHAHGIWHFCVLIGSIGHFIAVIGYVRA